MRVFESPGLAYTLGASLALHALVVLGTTAGGRLSVPAPRAPELLDRWVGSGLDTLPVEEVDIEALASDPVLTEAAPAPSEIRPAQDEASPAPAAAEPAGAEAAPPPTKAPAKPPREPTLTERDPSPPANPTLPSPVSAPRAPRAKPDPLPDPKTDALPSPKVDALPSPKPDALPSPKVAGESSLPAAPAVSAVAGESSLPAAPGVSAPAVDAAALAPGGSDLPPGVRPLGTAFTRALPYGSRLDPFWRKAKVGALGHARVEITTAADGALLEFRILERELAPPALVRMLTRAHELLKRGHFALSNVVEAGSLFLEVEVSVSDGPPSPDELARPEDVTELGFKAPEKERPGGAHFSLASGRRVDATVRYGDPPF